MDALIIAVAQISIHALREEGDVAVCLPLLLF